MRQRSGLSPMVYTRAQTARDGDTSAANVGALETMSFDALVRRAVVECEHFRQNRSDDTRFSYEIFRRALVERDELAWEYIYNQYQMQVMSWVRRSDAFASSGETGEYFANAAFMRFARAITPDRFANFPVLSALLNYLRRCTESVVMDDVRAWPANQIVPEAVATIDRVVQAGPDDAVIARIGALETWQHIMTLVHGEAEQEVIYRSFVLGMQPNEIYATRRDLFASVHAVYAAKRSVLARLRSSQVLQHQLTSP